MSSGRPALQSASTRPVCVYILFHDHDREHRDALARHLAGLARSGLVSLWDRSQLAIGSRQPVEEVVTQHRAEAELVLVLTTPHLLADNALLDELRSVQEQGQARVVPVLVQPADWQSSPLADLHPLPARGQFIATEPNPERVWLQVAQQLKDELLSAAIISDASLRARFRLRAALYRRYLMPWALLLSLGGLYLLGDQALFARTHLLGIADANFEYSAGLRLWVGAQVLPGLGLRIAYIPSGGWPERLAALAALFLGAGPWILQGRARVLTWLALALPTLCAAVALLIVVSVHHVLLAPEGTNVDVPVLGKSCLGACCSNQKYPVDTDEYPIDSDGGPVM